MWRPWRLLLRDQRANRIRIFSSIPMFLQVSKSVNREQGGTGTCAIGDGFLKNGTRYLCTARGECFRAKIRSLPHAEKAQKHVVDAGMVSESTGATGYCFRAALGAAEFQPAATIAAGRRAEHNARKRTKISRTCRHCSRVKKTDAE